MPHRPRRRVVPRRLGAVVYGPNPEDVGPVERRLPRLPRGTSTYRPLSSRNASPSRPWTLRPLDLPIGHWVLSFREGRGRQRGRYYCLHGLETLGVVGRLDTTKSFVSRVLSRTETGRSGTGSRRTGHLHNWGLPTQDALLDLTPHPEVLPSGQDSSPTPSGCGHRSLCPRGGKGRGSREGHRSPFLHHVCVVKGLSNSGETTGSWTPSSNRTRPAQCNPSDGSPSRSLHGCQETSHWV